uniref:Uncharacterized protein n=1 Tax=Trieres chinensis TaxID=1514140 RepID=A0A7S2EQI0_TRICV|mmetsp:Transcript_34343/g.70132  ORF Transcript_34343/g.70132 Transcript_34343/m.70132 type:complete len:252 (+) Transcript_34343:218-973(+)|eukprot:CAMPEP_0183308460 /NCGR_PEP_ID=MMETSP0160_2-20130417/22132_1 /TAXON_ID=2839 ORGANISM="Odontella Sinensis, Strain Grunow 1884" /NCGR_SAMPLE_ID=MMETSP0160_2 /ASSEMBLY_ACC=CAM_ASM_000250 /LENGTH=251 /DNA_ID=CAMNT_0025472303 /DNA_START=218 /DNA_END=973 /DNA_ORIENTATION=-
MIVRVHASVVLALAALAPAPAASFSRATVGTRPAFSVGSAAPTSATSLNSHAIDSEEDAVWLMTKAKECAHSDSCSIDEAEGYLRDVVHVQSSCVAGTLAGREACDDIGFAAEVVSALREKIENGRSRVGAGNVVVSGGALAIDDSLSPFQVGILALACLYAAAVLSSVGSSSQLPLDVVPFTPQEWWWSVRDGYVGDMVSQYVKNGGLVVSSNDIGEFTSPSATAEEWMWAMRGGYVGDMVSHVFRNGGI